MARLAISELTTFRWSFEEDVHQFADAGVPAIGVWRDKLSDFGVDRGAVLLEESGLEVSSLMWAGGFTGSDGRSFDDALADAGEALREAATIGAPCVLLYSGARGSHIRKHAQRLFRIAIDALLPQAEAADVALALEPMHPGCASEWTMLTSLREAADVLEEYPSPHLQLAFDTYHLAAAPHLAEAPDESSIGGEASLLRQVASRIGVVQLGDARQPPCGEQNRCRLGEGSLPLRATVERLRELGYDGYYEVELMGEDLQATDYQDLLRDSQLAYEQLVH